MPTRPWELLPDTLKKFYPFHETIVFAGDECYVSVPEKDLINVICLFMTSRSRTTTNEWGLIRFYDLSPVVVVLDEEGNLLAVDDKHEYDIRAFYIWKHKHLQGLYKTIEKKAFGDSLEAVLARMRERGVRVGD